MRTVLRSMSMVAALALVIWLVFGGLAALDGGPPPPRPADNPHADADDATADEVHVQVRTEDDVWHAEVDGRRFNDADELAAYLAREHSGRARAVHAGADVPWSAVDAVLQACLREEHVDFRLTREAVR